MFEDRPDDFRRYGGRLTKLAFVILALRTAVFVAAVLVSIVGFFVVMAHGIGPTAEQREAGIRHSQDVFDAMVARQHRER